MKSQKGKPQENSLHKENYQRIDYCQEIQLNIGENNELCGIFILPYFHNTFPSCIVIMKSNNIVIIISVEKKALTLLEELKWV